MRPETLRPELAHADEFDLCGRRVHEAEGRGRRTFALFQAVRHPGPLVWILPAHVPELPMLRGLPKGVGERLHLFRAEGETDLLWCIEEALRSAPRTGKAPVADRRASPATGGRGRADHRPDADPRRRGQQCHRNALGLCPRSKPGGGLDSALLDP